MCAMLNKKTLNYTGITNDDQVVLSKKNDYGAQFSKIADYIEKHL